MRLLLLFLYITLHINNCYAFSVSIANKIGIVQLTRLKAVLLGNISPSSDDEPNNILEIQCKSMKLGGLRFALGLFLIGQQNNPVKGSWAANQATETTLDMYYEDGTGMFTVRLSDKSITVERNGSKPSLRYLLNESVMLHCLIDELNSLATEGDDIKDEDRLLHFATEDILSKAREKLPARAA